MSQLVFTLNFVFLYQRLIVLYCRLSLYFSVCQSFFHVYMFHYLSIASLLRSVCPSFHMNQIGILIGIKFPNRLCSVTKKFNRGVGTEFSHNIPSYLKERVQWYTLYCTVTYPSPLALKFRVRTRNQAFCSGFRSRTGEPNVRAHG